MLEGILNFIASFIFATAPALAMLLLIVGLAFLHPQIYLLSMIIVSSANSMPIFGIVSGQLSLARWILLAVAAIIAIATAFRNSFAVLLVKIKTIQVLMICMLAIIACSSVYSVNPLLSYMKGLTLLMLALLFIFGHRHFVGNGFERVSGLQIKIGWMLRTIVGGSIAYALVAPGVAFLGLGFGGLYGHPNALGAMLGIFAVPFFLYDFICERRPEGKIFHGVVLLITTVSILATRSRASLLAAVGASFLILYFLRRKAAVALLALMLVSFGFIWSFDLPLFQDVSQEFALKGGEMVLGTRAQMWEEGIENIKGSPFWGWGFGTSKESITGWGTQTGGAGWTLSTTAWLGDREKGSSYLGITEELGFIGAIPAYLLILFLIGQLLFILRMRQVVPRAEWMLLLLLYSVIISGLINAGFEAWFFSLGSHITILYWIVVFLYFGFRHQLEASFNHGCRVPIKS